MITFGVGSLRVFILARPPVVIFTLGLLAITMTIFFVAFYINDKDLVLDSHAQEDWNSLVKHLSSQKLCTNISYFKQSSTLTNMMELQPPLAATPSNGTCFPVQVDHLHSNANLSQWLGSQKSGNAVRLSGHINLKGWIRYCQSQGSSQSDNNSSVAVTLVIPSTSFEYSDKVLSSPWLYFSGLPHLQQPLESLYQNDLCQTLNVSREVVGNFFSYDDSKFDFCKPENVMQLTSNISNFKPKIYLSMVNKQQIFTHLLQIGYLFLCVIFILLLAIVMQARHVALSQQHSLLPSKEMP